MAYVLLNSIIQSPIPPLGQSKPASLPPRPTANLVVLISICELPISTGVYAMPNLVQSYPPNHLHSKRIIPGIPDPGVIVARFCRSSRRFPHRRLISHRRLPLPIMLSYVYFRHAIYPRTQSFPPFPHTTIHSNPHSNKLT